MANNKISGALESATAWAPTPAIYQDYKAYAAKLDRLVEAARNVEEQIHSVCGCSECEQICDELTAALKDIELESK